MIAVDGRRRLLRLVIEKVRVTGWRIEIHLKIPLPDDPPDHNPPPPVPEPDNGPSSDMRLRSVRDQHMGVVKEPVDGRGRGALGHELVKPLRGLMLKLMAMSLGEGTSSNVILLGNGRPESVLRRKSRRS